MADVSPPLSLHSRHDPAKEARRYVDAQKALFNPVIVFVSEPGESWLEPALRERYPQAKLVALRYQDDRFRDSDGRWDAVWRPADGGDLSRFLFNLVPDEYLPLTLFLPWKPSDTVWPDAARAVWQAIASMIRLQQGVMHTRSHFGRRWLSNMVHNAVNVRSASYPVHTAKPVFLACAGPSLERQLPLSAGKFYVCAVSSALACLEAARSIPDLCMATDGGYWALDHFRAVDPAVSVAFPLEAAIPNAVLESNDAVLLTYGSALETALFELAGITPEPAVRNGTVSGTAALFALSHTDNSVYAGGLDLRTSASFSHARPHASDVRLSAGTDRLHPLCDRLFERNLDTGALDLYASWFSSRDAAFRNRFFRLLPEVKPLAGIRSVAESAVTADAGMQTVKTGPQCIPGTAERRRRIALWLGSLAGRFGRCTDPSDILADPVMDELLQLVSYTDYLRFLKTVNRGIEGNIEAVDAAAELCKKTALFLERLRARTEAGGQSDA